MSARQLSLAVVGLQHPNANGSNRKFEALVCVPGEPVHLVPEPKNKADPHAVAVFNARGVQIGYLAAERAPWIRGIISRGEEVTAIFQDVFSSTAAIRVAIGGGDPELPIVSPSADIGHRSRSDAAGDQDWSPDDIPSDMDETWL